MRSTISKVALTIFVVCWAVIGIALVTDIPLGCTLGWYGTITAQCIRFPLLGGLALGVVALAQVSLAVHLIASRPDPTAAKAGTRGMQWEVDRCVCGHIREVHAQHRYGACTAPGCNCDGFRESE